jgi:hypothetical protein
LKTYSISTQYIEGQVSFADRVVRFGSSEEVVAYLEQQFCLEQTTNPWLTAQGLCHFVRWARTRCDIYEVNKMNGQATPMKPADFFTCKIPFDKT